MTTEHSPLPWAIQCANWGYRVLDARTVPVITAGYRDTEDQVPYGPDALFIVEACNAYPGLVAEVERLRAAVSAIATAAKGGDNYDVTLTRMLRAVAVALAGDP